MRRVPAPLAAILAIALVHAVAWAVVLPAFQGPDDIRHFTYVQRIVEERSLPWTVITDSEHDPQSRWSTEVRAADLYAATAPLRRNAAMRPYAERVDEQRWAERRARLTGADRRDAGFNAALRNPPLYYVYEAVPYAAFSGADVLTRQFVMALATIPFFLLAVLGAWLLAGEVFGRRRLLQAITAATVALQPMLAHLSGIVNPDPVIVAEWALGLWLCAAVLRRGLVRPYVVGLAAVLVAGALTHGRALPLFAPAALALALAAWRATGPHAPATRRRLSAAAAGALVVVGGGVVAYALNWELSAARVREFASYLWQFYLPRPGFMEPAPGAGWGVRDVLVDRLFSGYAHLEVNLAPGVLNAVAVGEVAFIVALAAVAIARRASVRAHARLLGVLAVAPVAVLTSLHVAAWRSLQISQDPVITGRYLLVLAPLAGLGLAAIAASLPRRVGPAVAGAVLGALLVLSFASLATTLVRFHV